MAGDAAGVRRPVSVLILVALLAAVLHVRAFYAPHTEGDEMAYMALAREMSWDLSHYTTRDDPVVSRYPYSIYRQELFHQPPLFPLVLKVGMAFGQPVAAGLAFELAAVLLLLGFAWRAARMFALSVPFQVALYAALVLCPLLVFSTTRLHHDALLGILLFCGLLLQVEAQDESSTAKAIGAGLLLAAALNLRYNALGAVPLVLAVQLFHVYRRPRDPSWRCFAIVAGLVVVLGLPHYLRVVAAYGSLLPSRFLVPDADVGQWNEFLRQVHERTRLRSALELIAIYPMLLTWLTPATLRAFRARFRERSWACALPFAAMYLVALHLVALHQQLRYFAVASPFLLLAFVLQLQAADPGARATLWKWAGATLVLMAVGAIYAIFTPNSASVVPAVYPLLPFLTRLSP